MNKYNVRFFPNGRVYFLDYDLLQEALENYPDAEPLSGYLIPLPTASCHRLAFASSNHHFVNCFAIHKIPHLLLATRYLLQPFSPAMLNSVG